MIDLISKLFTNVVNQQQANDVDQINLFGKDKKKTNAFTIVLVSGILIEIQAYKIEGLILIFPIMVYLSGYSVCGKAARSASLNL